jgi:hypothetical protein
VLAFSATKIDILTRDDLVKLCADFYDDEEIWHAKQTLFDVCGAYLRTSNLKLIPRKGVDKKKNNMLDICNCLVAIRKDEMPVFAARDLMRLPPLDISHIDVTVLLREMTHLREQMQKMNQRANDVEELRKDVADLKRSMVMAKEESTTQLKKIIQEQTNQDFPALTINKETEIIPERFNNGAPDTYSKVVANIINTQPKVAIATSTQKAKPVIGTRVSARLIVKNSRMRKVFVTGLNPETSEEDMESYLKDELNIQAKCHKLKTRYDTYASFKIEAQCSSDTDILNPDMWPKGLLVKPFFERRERTQEAL